MVEERWRREYPRAAAELEETARNFLAKGTFRSRALSGQTYNTDELTVASSGDKRLYILDRRTIEAPNAPRRPYKSEVRCRTPEYVFKLTKETFSDPYVLAGYSEKFDDEALDFNYDYDLFARCAAVYMQKSLLQRMKSPTFVVKSVKGLQEEGGEIVRIDYDIEEEHASQSGSVYLDPNRNWAIRRAEVVSDFKKGDFHYEFSSEVDYQQVGEGRFLPKRMELKGKTKKPDIYNFANLELTKVTTGDVPDRIFKLSAYGLPDVPLRPAQNTSIFFYRNPLFWGSLIVAVTSFALLRIIRPRTNSATPTP